MMVTRVTNHTAVASGEGESTVFRHDITFREVPESYRRRMAEQASKAAAKELVCAPAFAAGSGARGSAGR